MPRSSFGGRHELGQNFLHHRPTIARMTELVTASGGSILELGAGDGAVTRALAALGRPLTAVELDEHRAGALRRALPSVVILHADLLRVPFDDDTIVGNIPFHLTTPVLRRLMSSGRWTRAVLLTQWEVARKRAGVGGGTLLTAQSAPWFTVELRGRVPSWAFTPRPSVDGGLLQIERRDSPLVPFDERRAYEAFARRVFSARGRGLTRILETATGVTPQRAARALDAARARQMSLPRDLRPEQWAALWRAVRG